MFYNGRYRHFALGHKKAQSNMNHNRERKIVQESKELG